VKHGGDGDGEEEEEERIEESTERSGVYAETA
jgi:hypothetical protein